MIFRRSDLQKQIEQLLKGDTESNTGFPMWNSLPVRTEAEARSICSALDTLREKKAGTLDRTDSILHSITAYFQHVEGDDAFQILICDGLPRLRVWVEDLLDGDSQHHRSAMFILKILALYRQREDVELIAPVARKPDVENEYIWSTIFGCFDSEHPFVVEMIDALREPLPNKFVLVAFLDMANTAAIAGKITHHPFDTREGRKNLEQWLSDTNEDNFSYAISSTVALPFIESTAREALLAKAKVHPDTHVQMEAAWVQGKTGDTTGLDRLAEFCLFPAQSTMAQRYLEELGKEHLIPIKARDSNFRALAEMANWLAYPTEFGQPPDDMEIIDSRELYWPPTNDRRQVFLIRYYYGSGNESKAETGIGMVGSDTFALFGETTPEMSVEDLYGAHCAWELEMNGDPRKAVDRTAEAGRSILSQYNDGFA